MVGADYSPLDRLIHRLAFRTVGLQKILSESEDDMFSHRLQNIEIAKPVYICSLPRAGTTLLLNLLSQLPVFATHTYRNMPFLLCPLMWDSLTRAFRKDSVLKERAHGDAVEIGYDSPEAFEEVLWKAFWPENYRELYIQDWQDAQTSEDFDEFFKSHIVKIISLATDHGDKTGRYLSKNNANIARIPYLERLFSDCRIVIPFRNPIDHVTSLLTQHKNFLERHKVDSFAREYMAAIGHFDFGSNLKPIDFENWFSDGRRQDPLSDEFWLRYWIAAFTHLRSRELRSVIWIDYDELCRSPKKGLERLFEHLEIDDKSRLSGFAQQLRAPTGYADRQLGASAETMKKAEEIHQDLKKAATISA